MIGGPSPGLGCGDACGGARRGADVLADAEVDDLDLHRIAAHDEDVVGLQIEVQQRATVRQEVRGLQGREDLQQDRDDLLQGHALLLLEQLGQFLTAQELHDEVVKPVGERFET
jgi:hypothetical protein